MNSVRPSPASTERPVLVVGAGMAGARCASLLRAGGAAVWVVDKSRGPGGRLATRRGAWTDGAGTVHPVAWDHGAPGFEAEDTDFLAWLHAQAALGRARAWQPRLAGQGLGALRWCGWPAQPALCQALLEPLPVHWQHTVLALHRGREAWTLDTDRGPLGPFGAVVLALPPAQAAPLLAPHRDDWARAASLVPMQPCWTLMGVTEGPPALADADWWQPRTGPIERLMRQSVDVGGGPALTWVAHARPAWSRQHLEAPAEAVRAALQAAVDTVLGHTLRWHHAAVHRWRYAQPALPPRADWGGARWDAERGLGLCGDHLVGAGVEAAWRSGGELARRIQATDRSHPTPLPTGRANGVLLPTCAP